MGIIKDLFKYSEGKKTFVVGLLMIILGFLQGDNQMILNGLGFITVRLAIKNP